MFPMIHRMRIRTSLLLVLLSSSPSAHATDYVWVIGGGADVDSAGVQIEYNVSWLLQVLDQIPGERDVRLYFGAGDDGTKDIIEWSADTASQARLAPLARVFGNEMQIGETYRITDLDNIAGTTTKDELLPNLRAEFAQLQPGDRAFIIYNGHGGLTDDDAGNNTLRLWDNSLVTAREFETLLGSIDDDVPTRFLFAQCYSGGFSRLIRPGGDDVTDVTTADRCGFLAASDYQQSEGCSPSVKTGDYRDYTTHFFATYSGETREGREVQTHQDLDGDGEFTMFDAHLYALSVGYSRSVPRATSEAYLDRWQPWHLRWLDTARLPENVYGYLANEVTASLGLPQDNPELTQQLLSRTEKLRSELAGLEQKQARDKTRILELQAELQKEVGWRWPESRSPYTDNYVRFLEQDLDAAQSFITEHEHYADLASLQDEQITLDAAILRQQREIVEIEKIRRLRKLSRLLSQFERFASDEERVEYDRLKACETSAF